MLHIMTGLVILILLIGPARGAEPGCDIPENLHPVSRNVLDAYLQNKVSPESFLRDFTLPNSEYYEVAWCIVDNNDPGFRQWLTLPFAVKYYILSAPSRDA